MTVDVDVLVEHGVLRTGGDAKSVTADGNLHSQELESFAREVVELYSAEVRRLYKENDGAFGIDIPANFWSERQVAVDPAGRPALSIFPYNADLMCLSQPMHLMDSDLPVFFAGDALREPFWPMGEGCSRGFMGALDTVWAVRCWAQGLRGKALLKLRRQLFDCASQVDPRNCGRDVLWPHQEPVPVQGLQWLSHFGRISWPSWGFDGRKRATVYTFTADPSTRYRFYQEYRWDEVENEEAPRLDSGALILSELLSQGLLVQEETIDDGGPLQAALRELTTRTGSQICLVARAAQTSALAAAYSAVRASLGPERLMWHGTSWDCVPNIVRSGFNRAYAFNARHGSKLGRGVYFAEDPGYALRFAGRGATRCMLLSGVLPGNSARGKEGLLEPPRVDATGARFDSTCDDPGRPRVFCVFKDFQALPLYLVQVSVP
ncbi:unnamed protein product [Effrenium voratum]|nr:unnamed protein product [Effrenium voratum]